MIDSIKGLAAAPKAEKDLLLLKRMAERAEELLAEYQNMAPDERRYAIDLVFRFTRLVDAFRRSIVHRRVNRSSD